MSASLRSAVKRRRAAEDAIAKILKRDYPPHTPVSWNDGMRIRKGVVLMNCYGDRISVLNGDTGRERFITASQIR